MYKKIKCKDTSNRLRKRIRNNYSIRARNKSNLCRLSVFRSGKHIYAQLIDDAKQVTLVSASSLSKDIRDISTTKKEKLATTVGRVVAERAIEKGIKSVVFSRGSSLFHGNIQLLANAARDAGLNF